jgi:hypothetical protein
VWVDHQFKKRDAASTKAENLERELAEQKESAAVKLARVKEEAAVKIEAAKELHVTEWRKNQTEVLCKVKTVVEIIEEKLDRKVDKEDCLREEHTNAINTLKTKLEIAAQQLPYMGMDHE